MEWLTNLLNAIKTKITGGSGNVERSQGKNSVKKPIFNNAKNKPAKNEISMISDISDEQIQAQKNRAKYINTVKNPDYKVKPNESPDKIAQKFGITTAGLLAANRLNEQTAKNIKVGQVLKIPPTRKLKNVNNLSDIAKSMGVSVDFIKRLKSLEDDKNFPENKFHNTPYTDNSGVKTIGIGHRLVAGDKTKLSNAEVCTLCAKDLLKAEEHLVARLGGQKIYDRIPQHLKEAVLDLTFNKGIVNDETFNGLMYCLKTGKWEAAVNKLTYNKSIKTQKEMSGLSKRRLFDIATATKMYGKNIPQTNKNTAQNVYNRGVQLLRAECKAKNLNFANQIAGYNKEVQGYFGNRIKLKLITA